VSLRVVQWATGNIGTYALRGVIQPSDDVWPSEWIPRKLEATKARFADCLEHEVGNQ
jgi:acyl-CoA dehydrogenase